MKKFILIIALIFFTIFLKQNVSAETFAWPSAGYIGWLYAVDTGTSEGIHTGIDIWNNQTGTWTNNEDGNSNAIYAAYGGTIVFKGDNPSSGDGYIIYHNSNLYTAYWHIINKQKNLNDSVNMNDYLGNQANLVAVHVHFAVLKSGSDNYANSLDPSSYLGRQLKSGESGAPGWLDTYVSTGSSCGGANVIIQNQTLGGATNCFASVSITILPETTITGTQTFRIQ